MFLIFIIVFIFVFVISIVAFIGMSKRILFKIEYINENEFIVNKKIYNINNKCYIELKEKVNPLYMNLHQEYYYWKKSGETKNYFLIIQDNKKKIKVQIYPDITKEILKFINNFEYEEDKM